MEILSGEEKLMIALMPEDELIDLHFGLGLAVRNAFGLHKPESKLLSSCGTSHPDDASGVIKLAHYGERYRLRTTTGFHGEKMGIQDRDYYRERYRNQKPPKKGGGSLKYLLIPAIMMASLWYGADALLKYQAEERIKAALPIEPITGGVVLKSDRQGHFRGTALINDVPMPFMIDTGATTTVIPEKMAAAAGLPFGRSVQTKTAGGTVYDRETRISSLKIGNAVIRNLDAQINGYIDQALIGMNTLKHFRISQNEGTLTLVANNQSRSVSAIAPVIGQPVSNTPTIRKALICDEHNNCQTTYSDQ
jgi:aspartyl protease family protein